MWGIKTRKAAEAQRPPFYFKKKIRNLLLFMKELIFRQKPFWDFFGGGGVEKAFSTGLAVRDRRSQVLL
jgi:hypothetical protein